MVAKPEAKLRMSRLRQVLVQQGYQEAITYSFIDPEMQKLFDPKTTAIELANPISADLSAMRTSLWPGLVTAVKYNLNRQQNRVSLFEYGLKFVPNGDDLQQEKMLAGVITGSKTPEQWGEATQSVDFYDLKKHIEDILEITGRASDFRFESKSARCFTSGTDRCDSRFSRKRSAYYWLVGRTSSSITKEARTLSKPVSL